MNIDKMLGKILGKKKKKDSFGIPKLDGSGKGLRLNRNRGGCYNIGLRSPKLNNFEDD